MVIYSNTHVYICFWNRFSIWFHPCWSLCNPKSLSPLYVIWASPGINFQFDFTHTSYYVIWSHCKSAIHVTYSGHGDFRLYNNWYRWNWCFGLHNNQYGWNRIGNWCLVMPISYIVVMVTSDYIITGTSEIELKIDAWWYPYHI